MRKAINTIALLCFILLVIDTLNGFTILLNFILVGELPLIKIALPPSIMLLIMTAIAALVILEMLSRRVDSIRRLRRNILSSLTKRTWFGRSFRTLDA